MRAKLGRPTLSYRGLAWMDQLSDRYADKGIVFGYADAGTVDHIELSAPAHAEVDGVSLRDASSSTVLARLARIGLEVREVHGLWEVPVWGIALFVQGGRIGERPFDAVTAFAHGPAAEPSFFGTPTAKPAIATEIDPRGFGPVRLGMRRGNVRALLGEGMATALPGRDSVDLHFTANVAVTYDPADTARRICAMAEGVTVAGVGGAASVGRSYADCVEGLSRAGVRFEEREAEILLPDSGIRLRTSRAGDLSSPVSSVVVQRSPAF
ncbi:hypothetical protein [Catenulispora subtropica]|uniref:hypothetical protein n=1 Tax=Catenulispora subtropica TaxID=450798 RepID=UPI0031DEAC34